ncbi:hypothetical protein [Roseomonas sp. USHLN139]|uniref:hypothetical protein n=1 Tax=Roseomonas sp. USHLN139 TaxID=3081298 RepID=UPI003B013DE2
MTALKQWLASRNLPAKWLATELQCHRVTAHRYIRAEDMPRPARVARIEQITEGAVGAAQLQLDYQARRAAS